MSSLSLQKEQLILFPWHFQFANNSYSSSVSNTLFAIGLLGIAAILLAAIMGFFTSMTIFPRNSSRQHRRNDESTTTSLKNHNTNYMRIPKNGQGVSYSEDAQLLFEFLNLAPLLWTKKNEALTFPHRIILCYNREREWQEGSLGIHGRIFKGANYQG